MKDLYVLLVKDFFTCLIAHDHNLHAHAGGDARIAQSDFQPRSGFKAGAMKWQDVGGWRLDATGDKVDSLVHGLLGDRHEMESADDHMDWPLVF